ncbi:MAG TPA: prepilin-type N-terminal cleavage/methylation domain-containing protein, partial [Nitrospiria bacterium]|nr:prepilin-type N-terminal cleavage/methylation domain-containing protein [Nitrospiria bacterium]
GMVVPPRKENAGGFTLIEVMVALAVLAVSFVVLIGLRNTDIAITQEVQHITRATLLAQKKIAELEAQGYPPLGIISGGFEDPDDLYTWTQTVNTIGLIPEDFAREVKVEVNWKDGEQTRSIDLVTFMVDPS